MYGVDSVRWQSSSVVVAGKTRWRRLGVGLGSRMDAGRSFRRSARTADARGVVFCSVICVRTEAASADAGVVGLGFGRRACLFAQRLGDWAQTHLAQRAFGTTRRAGQ